VRECGGETSISSFAMGADASLSMCMQNGVQLAVDHNDSERIISPLHSTRELTELSPGLRYTGQWRGDTMDGFGIIEYHDGSTYEGSICSNNVHGRGKLVRIGQRGVQQHIRRAVERKPKAWRRRGGGHDRDL